MVFLLNSIKSFTVIGKSYVILYTGNSYKKATLVPAAGIAVAFISRFIVSCCCWWLSQQLLVVAAAAPPCMHCQTIQQHHTTKHLSNLRSETLLFHRNYLYTKLHRIYLQNLYMAPIDIYSVPNGSIEVNQNMPYPNLIGFSYFIINLTYYTSKTTKWI